MSKLVPNKNMRVDRSEGDIVVFTEVPFDESFDEKAVRERFVSATELFGLTLRKMRGRTTIVAVRCWTFTNGQMKNRLSW